MLEGQGAEVSVAYTAEAAVQCLEHEGRSLDVVLLDQKLQGAGGLSTELDLLSQISVLAPFAKTLVVTGYASPGAVERAFQLGAYDHLQKRGAFEALLRAKVRNALEVTSERRAAVNAAAGNRTSELRAAWDRARAEPDANRKGKLLEELTKALFRATPGFEHVRTRLRNEVEEIDLVIENRSEDPLWQTDGVRYLLAECKNWSAPCGATELRNFHGKLTGKYQRARTGFFIAPGGFTSAFFEEKARRTENEVLVIPVDAAALERWISAADKLAVLRDLHRQATFDTAR